MSGVFGLFVIFVAAMLMAVVAVGEGLAFEERALFAILGVVLIPVGVRKVLADVRSSR